MECPNIRTCPRSIRSDSGRRYPRYSRSATATPLETIKIKTKTRTYCDGIIEWKYLMKIIVNTVIENRVTAKTALRSDR